MVSARPGNICPFMTAWRNVSYTHLEIVTLSSRSVKVNFIGDFLSIVFIFLAKFHHILKRSSYWLNLYFEKITEDDQYYIKAFA
jgi:hypothetical protein